MAHAGEGHHLHVTGLTHDEKGYPLMTPQNQGVLVRRLFDKIRIAGDDIIAFDEDQTENADVIVVSYGIISRAPVPIPLVRDMEIRVGRFRMITAWPFPEKRIRELSATTKAFVVPELNMGQMVREVERCAGAVT